MKTRYTCISMLATVLLSACGDSATTPITSTDPKDENTDAAVSARLKTFDNSDAFYSALREGLIRRHEINVGDVAYLNGNSNVSIDPSDESPAVDAVGSQEAAADTSDSAGGSGNDVTSTNVQELGVDEKDRVKVNASGTQLFVLSNNFYGAPEFILEDQPPFEETPEPLEDDPELADSMLAFAPSATTLRILQLDAEMPDATSINEMSIDLAGRNADGFYLYENDGRSSAIITASGSSFWSYWDQPEAFSESSVIARVDVTDAVNATLTDTFTLDGQIISSRRIGDALFFASRYYPAIPGIDPWDQNGNWRDTVENTNLAELMPEFSRNGSEDRMSLVDPSECFVAPNSADDPYYSPDIITLGVIDLSTEPMQLRDTTCFLGATETLYANTESVFLATTQYDYGQGPVTLEGDTVDINDLEFSSDMVWFDPRTSTDIHQFDISSDQLSYAGSGSVQGHLGWNALQKPFRMSESNGYLRVSTMNDRQGPDHSPILLTILQADGQGNLATVSSLPNQTHPEHIGKPGEQLYASRFIGDRAYLVTFRQTDPLYVIDMADPENPQIKGELEIEGYSDYLQPVGENHLLGIGKNAVAADFGFGDGRGAWVQGMKLSLFDVSDPADPREVQSVLLGERGTHSVALYNHRAITIQPANDLHPMRVSFGADVYGNASPGSSPTQDQAQQYPAWNYTGLHGFDITVGANANISPRGALIVERADGPYGYPGYGDDRSVMVNDAVFYVHGRDVYPALWDNLEIQPTAR